MFPHISFNPAGPWQKEKLNNCLVFLQSSSDVAATTIYIIAVPMMSRCLKTNVKDLALPQTVLDGIT